MSLDDEKWQELHGGYRVPYDVWVVLRSMQDGIDVWDELWDELHHQRDVDVAFGHRRIYSPDGTDTLIFLVEKSERLYDL